MPARPIIAPHIIMIPAIIAAARHRNDSVTASSVATVSEKTAEALPTPTSFSDLELTMVLVVIISIVGGYVLSKISL